MIKKTIASALVSLGIAHLTFQPNQIFAEDGCCESPCYETFVLPGDPIDPSCINAGYPYPATINPCCSWDVYARGDFLYLGASMEILVPIAQRFTFVDGINFQIDRTTKNLLQNSGYRPGFRVSLGIDLDSVILDASYMRFHSHTTSHFRAGANQGIALTGQAGSILDSSLLTGLPVLFSNVKSVRHINLDRLLISLQRPVYMSKRIIMNLNYGLLGYWIEQKWNMNCTDLVAPPVVLPPILTSNGFASGDHKSWAIGPDLGFKAIALLPWHLQAIFNLDLSVQYGYEYKGIAITSFPQAPFVTNNTTLKRGKTGYTQAIQNAEIGLGWGDYLGCDKYHVDLYVTYNFYSHYIFAFGIPYSATAVDANFFSFSLQGIAIGGRVDF